MQQTAVFLPPPQKLIWGQTVCSAFKFHPLLPQELAGLEPVLGSVGCSPSSRSEGAVLVLFSRSPQLGPEAYHLQVNETEILLQYGGAPGALYGWVTLGQLHRQFGAELPCCDIHDAPGLAVRGLMLDISRGKVPTLKSLYALADQLAQCKMNHLELYIEGFSFAYPSFPQVWSNDTALTPAELTALDAYCRARFIDFVPHQNSLGHMGAWLSLPEFCSLAASQDRSFSLMGMKMPPSTLDPQNPGSLSLVETLVNDLLPSFSSPFFHAGLDEPFGLEDSAEKTAHEQYFEYTLALYQMLAGKGKKMMIWGDTLAQHPDLAHRLPKDITVFDWGYAESYPFDQKAAVLKQAGLDFCLCPGTNSWSSFGGLTNTMLTCTRNASKAAYQYGAKGLIVTDWGDGGHLQYLPVSYAGIAQTAALAWNAKGLTEPELAQALNLYFYQDAAGVMGQFSLALGRYNQYEEFAFPCRTLAALQMMLGGAMPAETYKQTLGGLVRTLAPFAQPEERAQLEAAYENQKSFDYTGLNLYLKNLATQLAFQQMGVPSSETILAEYQNTLCIIDLTEKMRQYIFTYEQLCPQEQRAQWAELQMMAQKIIPLHKTLWLARNKPSGLAQSLTWFEQITH